MSFTAMIILMALNAVVAGMAGFSAVRQIQDLRAIEQIVRTHHQITITERNFARSLSRDDVNRVYQLLESAYMQVTAVQARFPGDDAGILLAHFGEIRGTFQKFVIVKDQADALKSRAIAMERTLARTINGKHALYSGHFDISELNHIISQLLDIQWKEQELQTRNRLISTEELQRIINDINSYERLSRSKTRSLEQQRTMFKILRDIRDYIAAFERYVTYQSHITKIEKDLFDISEQTNLICLKFETRIRQSIHQRTIAAAIATTLVFLLTILFANAMAVNLSRQIADPVSKLAEAARQIAAGRRDGHVTVEQGDEIGELADCFNLMAENLQRSEEELREHSRNLEQTVSDRTRELNEAFENLKQTQQQLINTEKMAVLGQLISGIAHDINTPLGVISSSVEYLKKTMHGSFPLLPSFLNSLDTEKQADFMALFNRALQKRDSLSSREERSLKKQLAASIDSVQGISMTQAEREDSAEYLSSMGIYEVDDLVTRILSHEQSTEILKTAAQLSQVAYSSLIIDLAVQRASKVVTALKIYARVEQEQLRKPVNINNDLEIVLTLYHNLMRNGVTVVRDYNELPTIPAYHNELGQVWMNLIHNALQAMNFSGTLTVHSHAGDGHVVVSIRDTGSGVPDSVRERIFEPFVTTKQPGEGSGLGLDIVSSIVKRHNGKVSFESKPGDTIFTVSLPIEITEEETA